MLANGAMRWEFCCRLSPYVVGRGWFLSSVLSMGRVEDPLSCSPLLACCLPRSSTYRFQTRLLRVRATTSSSSCFLRGLHFRSHFSLEEMINEVPASPFVFGEALRWALPGNSWSFQGSHISHQQRSGRHPVGTSAAAGHPPGKPRRVFAGRQSSGNACRELAAWRHRKWVRHAQEQARRSASGLQFRDAAQATSISPGVASLRYR